MKHIFKEFLKVIRGINFFFLLIVLPGLACSQDQKSSWQVFSLGSPALTINLPGIPEPMETRIEPSLLQIIQSYYAYSIEDQATGILVMLLHTSYAEEIHPDLNIIGDQTIRELETRGALHVKYKTASVNIDGKKGIRQTGTLESDDIKREFSTTILTDGSKIWKVITYAKIGDKKGLQMVQTILNSIALKEN